MAGKGSEYSKRSEGGATVFTVTPASSPKFTFLLILGGGIMLLGLLSMPVGIVFLAMGGFAFWYGWTRDLRPKDHRAVSTFKVTPNAVEKDGRSFGKEEIHRLILRNGVTDQELGVQVMTTNANVAAGMAHRANVARFANLLNVESGGKSHMLAGGMDETTAYGLLHDVSKVLEMKIS
jgi:hypothetical protein